MLPRANDIYATPDMLSDVRATIRVNGIDVNLGAAAQMITSSAKTAKAQPTKASLMKFYAHDDKAVATEQKLTPHARRIMELRRSKPVWNRERLVKLGLKNAARVLDNSQNPQAAIRRRRRDPNRYKILNAKSTFDVPLPQNLGEQPIAISPRTERTPQQGRYLALRAAGRMAGAVVKLLDAEPVSGLISLADNMLSGGPSPQPLRSYTPQPRRRQQRAHNFG